MPLKRCISDHVVHSRVWTFDYYWTLFCNCKEGKCFVKSICQTQFGISFECLKKCLEVVYDINSLKLIWYDFSRPCFFLLIVWRDQGVDTLQKHCCVSGRFHFNQVMYQFLSECCEILGAWLASKVPNDVHYHRFLDGHQNHTDLETTVIHVVNFWIVFDFFSDPLLCSRASSSSWTFIYGQWLSVCKIFLHEWLSEPKNTKY